MEKKAIELLSKRRIEILRKEIGKLMKEIRTEKKLTYYAVGKSAGVPSARILAIENGIGYSIDAFLKVLAALNCTLVIEPNQGAPVPIVNNNDIAETRKDIGEYLEKRRKQKKLTYYQILRATKIPLHAFMKIVEGGGYTMTTFIKLTYALDCGFGVEEGEG